MHTFTSHQPYNPAEPATTLHAIDRWWHDRDTPSSRCPATDLRDHGFVVVALAPGDMTEYRVIVTNLMGQGVPGRPLVAVSLLNVYRTCADFGLVELDPANRLPWAHEPGYVGAKLHIPEQHDCAANTLAMVTSLAVETITSTAPAGR